MNFDRITIGSLLFIIVLSTTLSAFSADEPVRENRFSFSIRYLGMRIAEVELTDNFEENIGRILIEARSVSVGNIVFRIENTYTVLYRHDFLPDSYIKSIRQKNFSQERSVIFNQSERRIVTITDGKRRDYQIEDMQEVRDFFSALLYLRETIQPEHLPELLVYANNNIWLVEVAYLTRDRVAKRDAYQYLLRFKQLSNNKRERADVLTNNIIKEESTLQLWISSDEEKLLLKAEYVSSPFSVFWSLEDYQLSKKNVTPAASGENEAKE